MCRSCPPGDAGPWTMAVGGHRGGARWLEGPSGKCREKEDKEKDKKEKKVPAGLKTKREQEGGARRASRGPLPRAVLQVSSRAPFPRALSVLGPRRVRASPPQAAPQVPAARGSREHGPRWASKPDVLGACLSVARLNVGVPSVGHDCLTPQGAGLRFELGSQGRGIWQDFASASPTCFLRPPSYLPDANGLLKVLFQGEFSHIQLPIQQDPARR